MQEGGESIGWTLALEFTPAAIFGSAVGFSAATALALPQFSATPLAAGAAAFGGVWLALRKFGSDRQQYPLPDFDQTTLDRELSPVAELLVQADVAVLVGQLAAPQTQAENDDELVLEDVVTAVEADSRVVQLFEPNATAGELQARIENHLRGAPRQSPDATQELHDALAALRRSLR